MERNRVCRGRNKSRRSWDVDSFNGLKSQHNPSAPEIRIPASTELDILPPFSPNTNPCDLINIVRESMLDVVGMVNSNQYDIASTLENVFSPPVKRVVSFKNFVLYPPSPTDPLPITKDRPIGCRTVFVCGMPEKITEEIVKEIFMKCGTIEAIKMKTFVFCHIRFSDESSVDNALYFSGYTLKIQNRDETDEDADEKLFTGQLHVDYAENFDDQYISERKQQTVQQETRLQDIDYRTLLPSLSIKEEESFRKFITNLITWLDKSTFTRSTSANFFSEIQKMHSKAKKFDKFKHEKDQLYAQKQMFEKKQTEEKTVFEKQQSEEKILFESQQKMAKEMFEKQQMAEKVLFEKPFKETKDKFLKQQTKVLQQLTAIEKVYKTASLQKCWDHFTKAQRKNIEAWKKHNEDLKNALLEIVINEREEEEMELSDDEDDKRKTCAGVDDDKEKTNAHIEQLQKNISELQEMIGSLRCQLETSKNKLIIAETHHEEELRNRDNQIKSLWESLQNSRNDVMILNRKCSYFETRFPEPSTLKYEVIEYNHNSNDTVVHESISHNYSLKNGT